MHYYKRNLGDYAKKAGRLTMLQHGAYNLLIDACYDREEFPTFDEAIDWVWASTNEEVESVKFVLAKFFTIDSGGIYIQKRVQEEIEEFHLFCGRQAVKGKKGGRPRKPGGLNKKPSGLSGKASGNPEESRCKAGESLTTNQEPLTTNHKPITNNQYKEKDKKEIADRVITALNEKAGKRFRLTDHNRGLVIARLNEDFTEADCIQVITNRCTRWIGTAQAEYLRPDTIFRPSKFESYLNDTAVVHGGKIDKNIAVSEQWLQQRATA